MRKINSNYLLTIGTILLAACIGFSIGKTSSIAKEQKNTRFEFIETSLPTIPTVNIVGIENGKLVGSIAGNVRLFIGDNNIIPNSDGAIEYDANSFLTNNISVKIPKGMLYIASKKGKYYYSVKSSDGERIVPKNRIYFKTEGNAEKAGYINK